MLTHERIQVLTRSDQLESEIERATAYLYRGWTVDTASVRFETPGDGYWLLWDIVSNGHGATSADYLADRLRSGLFGVKVVTS